MTDICGAPSLPSQGLGEKSANSPSVWDDPRRSWAAPPTFQGLTSGKYSLCHVLILGPIISDVCGSCDPTDDEGDPSADEVEPARDQKADFPETVQSLLEKRGHPPPFPDAKGRWLDSRATPRLV